MTTHSYNKSIKLVFLVLLLQVHELAFGQLNSNVNATKIRCIEKERRALLSFKNGISEFPIWYPDEDCCEWSGVHCNNETSHVIKIYIPPQRIVDYLPHVQSTINQSLIELTSLEVLDLSQNSFEEIPRFLGSLRNLRYLNLSNTNVSGTIPIELGNLLNLQYLDLSGTNYTKAQNIKWLSNLSSLEYLDLRDVNLSESHDWLQIVNRLPKLKTLRLGRCNLSLPILSPLSQDNSIVSFSNSSSVLEEIDLHGNRLTSSIFEWMFKHSRSLVYIDISSNQLNGFIPEALGDMSALQLLDLSQNQLEGEIPKSFRNLCMLMVLYLSGNRLNGEFETLIKALPKCTTRINSSDSDQKNWSLLRVLELNENHLNGTIPEVIGNFSELESFSVGGNSLRGVISEAHFLKLSKLQYLNLSSNSLVLNLSPNWVPPFQLDIINLGSVKMGPHFPDWIRTQKSYSEIDISNASIVGKVPSWFWHGLSEKSCLINLSRNQFYGRMENLTVEFQSFLEVDLSSNQFEGPIPSFLKYAKSLDLSNNKFSGPISFICVDFRVSMSLIDFSNNHLSGELPDCWVSPDEPLLVLDLANNNFSGKLPPSIGSMEFIRALQLRNNHFSGELPKFLYQNQNLEVLDLGGNSFSGPVPGNIGELFTNLIVLSLRSNRFRGRIPSQLCNLGATQLFDISGNKISGQIPKCLKNLTALTQRDYKNSKPTIRIPYTSGLGSQRQYKKSFDAESSVNWQGKVYQYKNQVNLGYMKLIDLSNNNLTGEIPDEITSLLGLVSLNLSSNGLEGKIPTEIGDLEELNILDLSRNKLRGEIPISLVKIYRLSTLNLSNNNLTGRIPTGGTQLKAFEASSYAGNPGLCGFPLEDCGDDNEEKRVPPESSTTNTSNDQDSNIVTQGFYISIGLGYAVGIWVFLGTLMLSRTCRYKYYEFLNSLTDWLYTNKAKKGRSRQRMNADNMSFF